MSVHEIAKQMAWSGALDGSAQILTGISFLCDDKEERDDMVQRVCALQHRLADIAGINAKESFSDIVASTQALADIEREKTHQALAKM